MTLVPIVFQVGEKLYRAVQEQGHVTVKRIMEFIASLSNARSVQRNASAGVDCMFI